MADTRQKDKPTSYAAADLVIRDFAGMQPNRDPHDVDLGKSAYQRNCGAGPAGELRVRGGLVLLQFGGG